MAARRVTYRWVPLTAELRRGAHCLDVQSCPKILARSLLRFNRDLNEARVGRSVPLTVDCPITASPAVPVAAVPVSADLRLRIDREATQGVFDLALSANFER